MLVIEYLKFNRDDSMEKLGEKKKPLPLTK